MTRTQISRVTIKLRGYNCVAKLMQEYQGDTAYSVIISIPEGKSPARGRGDSVKDAFDNASEIALERLKRYDRRQEKQENLAKKFSEVTSVYR